MKPYSHNTNPPCQPRMNLFTLPFLMCLMSVLLWVTGCKSPGAGEPVMAEAAAVTATATRLNPGDVVQISFPGAPTMNTTERVRLDGHILLPLVGEVEASGKTPAELQSTLSQLYSKHLQVKEVVVIMASSSASVFVAGAVARPGRITME